MMPRSACVDVSPGRLEAAVLEITNRCNLRCRHCASSSGRARDRELTLTEILDLLDRIRDLGGREVTILGGEPLLRPDWYEICRGVRERGMQLIFVTNGLLLEARGAFERLRELEPLVVAVSLDGASPETYRQVRGVDGFETAMAALDRLVADGHRQVSAITTFTRRNLAEFDGFVALFRHSPICWQVQVASPGGVRFDRGEMLRVSDYEWLTDRMRRILGDPSAGVQLVTMDDFGYFPLDAEPALRAYFEAWEGCRAGLTLIGVRSNGDVLGCLSLSDEFVEANVRQVPLEEIWTSGRWFGRLRAKVLEGACATCVMAERCRAGCAAMAHGATGRVGANPYCLRHLQTSRLRTAGTW